MRLALGTVQFGLDYGVSNTEGLITDNELEQILAVAERAGIDTLDTAAAYGCAQRRLGEHKAGQRFRVITKLSSDAKQGQGYLPQLEAALGELKTEHVSALLLHSADELLADDADQRYLALTELKRQQLVTKVGVSVYTPQQLTSIIDRYPIEIVQLPFSCLDQRFAQTGLLQRLHAEKIEVHARSLLLQGLLLMEQKPDYFQPYQAIFARFERTAKQAQISKLSLALSILNAYPELDRAVLGCTSAAQLSELLQASASANKLSVDWQSLATDQESLLLPFNWNL